MQSRVGGIRLHDQASKKLNMAIAFPVFDLGRRLLSADGTPPLDRGAAGLASTRARRRRRQ